MTITAKISAWFKTQVEWWAAHWEAVSITGCLALLAWAVAIYLGHPNAPLAIPPGGKVVALAPMPTFDVIQDGSRLVLLRHRDWLVQAMLLFFIYVLLYPFVSLGLSIWHDLQVKLGKRNSNRFPLTLRLIGAHLFLILILGFYLYVYGYRTFAIVAFPEKIVLDSAADSLSLNGKRISSLTGISAFYGVEHRGVRYRSGEWGVELNRGGYIQIDDDPFIAGDVTNNRGNGYDLIKYLNGFLEANTSQGFKYEFGEGVPRDYAKALQLFTDDANRGNVAAEGELGRMYALGMGVSPDYATAKYWIGKAAQQHEGIAEKNMGDLYLHGMGVTHDDHAAMRWYERASDDGDADAANLLGSVYQYGWGVPVDYKKAMDWYRIAAERGSVSAEYNVGTLYASGQGVTRNHWSAMHWFTQAANDGDMRAQVALGGIYLQGIFASADSDKSEYWFKKAAEHDFDNPGDYRRAVFQILNANVDYPPGLRYARVKGSVDIRIDLGNDKKTVMAVRLVKSSGNAVLDQAVLDGAKAALLPGMPDSMKQLTFLTATLNFDYDTRNE